MAYTSARDHNAICTTMIMCINEVPDEVRVFLIEILTVLSSFEVFSFAIIEKEK